MSDLSRDDIEFIRRVLRKGSVHWKGRTECLRLARKSVFVRRGKDGTSICKFHWQCADCKEWTKNIKEMEVDHIEEIGPFLGDWNDYIERHFPRQEGLQALCIKCHLRKTNVYNSAKTKWKRKSG